MYRLAQISADEFFNGRPVGKAKFSEEILCKPNT